MQTGIKHYADDPVIQETIAKLCEIHKVTWQESQDARDTSHRAFWFTSTPSGVAWSQENSCNFDNCPTTVSFEGLVAAIKGKSLAEQLNDACPGVLVYNPADPGWRFFCLKDENSFPCFRGDPAQDLNTIAELEKCLITSSTREETYIHAIKHNPFASPAERTRALLDLARIYSEKKP